jgi:hypothetical protein
MSIARQRHDKHSPGDTLSTIGHPLLGNGRINTHSRTAEEKCFPWGPCRGIIRGHRRSSEANRVEAGSNTSTVTLRVVGGDETGSLKSEAVKYGHESQGTRTRGRIRW